MLLGDINTQKIDTCIGFLFFTLIPSSVLFTEVNLINSYFITLELSILTIIICARNIIKREVVLFSSIDLLILFVIIISFISSSVKKILLNESLYNNLLLFYVFLLISKTIFQTISIRKYLCVSILLVNICVNLFLIHYYFRFNYLNLYIENHFSNTSIYAIFLAISTLIIFETILFRVIKIYSILYSFIAIINVFLIIYLGSRISLFIIILYFIFFAYSKIQFKKKILKRIIGLVLCSSIFFILYYFIKPTSSQGRTFILRITSHIIKENIWLGTGGINTFSSNYPLYQAKFFASGLGTEKNIMLADNINYALNEFLQFFSEIGIIGLLFILIFIIKSIFIIKKEDGVIKKIYFNLLFISCFSYIYHITVFQVIIFSIIIYTSLKDQRIFILNRYISISLNIGILFFCLYFFQPAYIKFNRSLYIERKISLRYTLEDDNYLLIKYFNDNSDFLIYYAYDLYYKRKYEESLWVLALNDKNYIHSEIENLKGNICLKLDRLECAEYHYAMASNMCPNRFRYKYDLFRFYNKTHREDLARKIALDIHMLKEKIPSATTIAIKNEVKEFLEGSCP